jgi:DNA modification methylase
MRVASAKCALLQTALQDRAQESSKVVIEPDPEIRAFRVWRKIGLKQVLAGSGAEPYHNGIMARDSEKPQDELAVAGPVKGEFVPPPPAVDEDERSDALPQQEEFWRPPTRFGSVPVEKEPLGWDRRKGFRKLFPQVMLPFQVVERVQFGHPELEPNRLFWGDNLHVMRQLPSESIDLIYIDPPFFSGRQYNVLFGDKNELRSFSDIWEGGMPGYLIWLNARLYEMKRLLKKSGSILIHCDLHASHYIKVEMDKIFGYSLLQNEIIWSYRSGGGTKRRYGRKHDVILWYTRSATDYIFNADEVRVPYDAIIAESRRDMFNEKGKVSGSVWDISRPPNHSHEWIGYPTQKPEAVLERVVKGHSREGDTVADGSVRIFVFVGRTLNPELGGMYGQIEDSPGVIG